MDEPFEQITSETLDVAREFLADIQATRGQSSNREPHPYSLRMTRRDRERLETLARALGLKASALARRIMIEGLARYEADLTETRATPEQRIDPFSLKLEAELATLRLGQAEILRLLESLSERRNVS